MLQLYMPHGDLFCFFCFAFFVVVVVAVFIQTQVLGSESAGPLGNSQYASLLEY